jgi:Methyltransferase domain
MSARSHERNQTEEQLMDAKPFNEAWVAACGCNILVSQNEGRCLHELARQAPENVVEIGSMHGGSAVLFAHAGVRRLTLIEPSASPLLVRSLAKFNLLHDVQLFSYHDYNVWPCWTSKISFMFLDHEHKFLSVRNSLAGWRPHLLPGARIAIHDYEEAEVKWGVNEFAPELEVIERIENLAIAVWKT